MPIARIDVWSSEVGDRSCRIVVYDRDCDLELLGNGQRLVSYRCPSVAAALSQAEQWRLLEQVTPRIAA